MYEEGFNPFIYGDVPKVPDVDTNRPDIRQQRIKNQKELEPLLSRMEDMSAVERMTLIRERLFGGFGNVRGDYPTRIRESEVASRTTLYPESKHVGEILFPAYIKVIDQLYDKVLEIKDENLRDTAVVRLASVAYTLGITIHPYKDGNGQTLRMLALSYIQELSQSKNSYLPYRDESGGRISGIDFSKFNTIPVLSDDQQLVSLLEIESLLGKHPTQDEDGLYDEASMSKWLSDARKIIPGVTARNASEVLEKQKRAIVNVVKVDSPEYEALWLSQCERLDKYLERMLAPENTSFLEKYLLEGENLYAARESTDVLYKSFALEGYKMVEYQILATLEPASTHNKRYKEITRKRVF